MRWFGIEEQFLVVGARTLAPLSVAEEIAAAGSGVGRWASVARPIPVEILRSRAEASRSHHLHAGLHQEQLDVIGPPVPSFGEQLEAIRRGRELAASAATHLSARVVALGSPVSPRLPHVTGDVFQRRVEAHFGLLAREQLTCGTHVHVEIASREEGVQVLDRMRVWLHVLLAMSANSPFWYGLDSSFASFRYPSWSRWPTAGPTEVHGSVAAYDSAAEALVRAGGAIDVDMLNYDARLCDHAPTLEVRVADGCPDARHAAALASITRALVETAARQWEGGVDPLPAPAGELRAWAWHAARHGLDGTLMSPLAGHPMPAAAVVRQLLQLVGPVLDESGELGVVTETAGRLLGDGPGYVTQRRAYSVREDLRDVVDAMLRLTHGIRPPDEPVEHDLPVSA